MIYLSSLQMLYYAESTSYIAYICVLISENLTYLIFIYWEASTSTHSTDAKYKERSTVGGTDLSNTDLCPEGF